MREGRKNPLCAQCTLCALIFVQAIDLAELCYNSRPHHLSQAAALHWSDITCWPRKKQETRLRFRPKARITPWGFLLLDTDSVFSDDNAKRVVAILNLKAGFKRYPSVGLWRVRTAALGNLRSVEHDE